MLKSQILQCILKFSYFFGEINFFLNQTYLLMARKSLCGACNGEKCKKIYCYWIAYEILL